MWLKMRTRARLYVYVYTCYFNVAKYELEQGLLEKLIVAQLVIRFSTFRGTRRIIIVFGRSLLPFLGQNNPFLALTSYLRFILILSSNLSLGLLSDLIPFISHHCHACYMLLKSNPPRIDPFDNIWLGVQIVKTLLS
jgi:hypothetical protein